MLFREGKSGLVRLSDCIKLGIAGAGSTTRELIALYHTHADEIAHVRDLARSEKIDEAQAARTIPTEDAGRGVMLQGRLHSECLSVILNICLALESYINSLAFHVLKEKDYLGLLRAGHDASAELLFSAIDRLSTLSKWEELARLNRSTGFDPSKAPFQDLKILFRFRDDIVHDKVRDYSEEISIKRYGGKLVDPVFGFLELSHVVYAAVTYWDLICRFHELTGISREDFHRHYNLTPWLSEEHRRETITLCDDYVRSRS